MSNVDQSLGSFDYKAIGLPLIGTTGLTQKIIGSSSQGVIEGANNDYQINCPLPPPTCCQTDLNLSPIDTALTSADNSSSSGLQANAGFYIGQNSGIPITELNVSIADISYTIDNDGCTDCVPNFALPISISGSSTIGTGTSVLTLEQGSNSNQEITWSNELGAMINAGNAIDFDFNLPPAASIPCCMTEANVCVKVSWKDANCVVCDTVLCFTIELEKVDQPCEMNISEMSSFYKCGSDMIISWNAANTNGNLRIYMQDGDGNTYPLENGFDPTLGTYTWPVTSTNGAFPCEEDLTVVIESEYYGEKCRSVSTVFQLECCETVCKCGKWSSPSATYMVFYKLPEDPKKKNEIIKPQMGKPIDCGKTIKLGKGGELNLTFSEYICEPSESCNATYTWEIYDENRSVVASNVGRNVRYQFSTPGRYGISITPKCGGEECQPCMIYVFVEGKEEPSKCDCGEYKTNQITLSLPGGAFPHQFDRKISCGKTLTTDVRPGLLIFKAPIYACSPTTCIAQFKWEILKDNGMVEASGQGNSFGHSFMGLSRTNYKSYTVRFTPICGGKECKPCEINLELRKD